MKVLLVVKSVHHGNTNQIAQAIGEVLNAEVVSPEEAPTDLSPYDLIGCGSGIYYGCFHHVLRRWLKQTKSARPNQSAFIISTSGLPWLWSLYHRPLRRRLIQQGFRVVDEFHCRGFDTFGPLWLFGGLHRHHPNESDLARAVEFAKGLCAESINPLEILDEQNAT